MQLLSLELARKLFPEEALVTAAVSGGPDSIAMLYTLLELSKDLQIKIQVAHFNHRLRVEADEDEAFVAALAANLKLDFYRAEADTKLYAKNNRLNLEAAARQLRYAFLQEISRKTLSTIITTGHNLDDQAETILFRLVRGTGPEGLRGIRQVKILDDNLRIVRPLLTVPRKKIEDYLHLHGYSYRLDPSNLSKNFSRNRIRQEVLPALKSVNPQAVTNLVRSISIVEQLLNNINLPSPDEDGRLNVPDLQQLPAPLAQMAIREAIRKIKGNLNAICSKHIIEALKLIEPGTSGKQLCLPDNIIIAREFQQLAITKKVSSPDKIQLRRGELSHYGNFLVSYDIELPEADYVAELRLSEKQIIVRCRSRGERFHPLGRQYKKLKDLMIDAKIPLTARDSWPIFCRTDGTIIWIPSIGLSSDYVQEGKQAKLFAKRISTSKLA